MTKTYRKYAPSIYMSMVALMISLLAANNNDETVLGGQPSLDRTKGVKIFESVRCEPNNILFRSEASDISLMVEFSEIIQQKY